MDNPPEGARSRLLDLAGQVADQDIPSATRYLESLVTGDAFLRRLLEAPYEEERLSSSCERLLDEAEADIAAGRLYSEEQVQKELDDGSPRSLHGPGASAS